MLLVPVLVVAVGAGTDVAAARQLASPKNLVASADSSTSIGVSFSTVPSASYYNLFLYGATGKSSKLYVNAQSSGTRIDALTPCTTYRVAVQAISTSQNLQSSVLSGKIAVTTQCIPALVPTFGTPMSTSDGFTVQITNYDAAFTWTAGVTAGVATIDSAGLVTVTGLTTDADATLTVATTRTGYDDGSASMSAARNSTPGRWIGAGDFTVEFWVKPTAGWSGRQELFVLTRPDASARLDIWYEGGAWTVYGDGLPQLTGYLATASIEAPAVGSWTHVALTRQSGTMRLYVAGQKVAETSNSTDLTSLDRLLLGADPNFVGCRCNLATALLSDVRVVDGTALYSGTTLVVPTSALTGIPGTTFLLNTALGQPSAGSVVLDGATTYEQTIDTSGSAPALLAFEAYRLVEGGWTPSTVVTSTDNPFGP